MRLASLLLTLAVVTCSAVLVNGYEDTTLEDDDFAEFEQFEADDDVAEISDFDKDNDDIVTPVKLKSPGKDSFQNTMNNEEEILVEDEDVEFEHFQDPEEFEGFQETTPKTSEQPKITISKVPITIRPRWDAYWLEGIFCCLLAAYAMAYVIGRGKNTAIAVNFLKMHKPLLDENFTLVGETGSDVVAESPEERGWRREAEHCYTMWCSGRLCCEGMLITLKLIKRQDLVHVLLGLVRPTPDTLLIRAELGRDDCDPFVFCVAQKKIATKLAKEMQDLSVFCPERRPGERHGLPATLSVMSECAEATAGVLDARTTAALDQYHASLQYLHISDRYAGPKQMEEPAPNKPPETERVLLASFALAPESPESVDGEVRPLLLLVLHLLDRLKRLRLSKEALVKCEKRRQKVAEAWLRGAHVARQEQAAARREEKRKQEKEKILAEDDPEKQRRWELKEQKRQLKRKTPKMKQLKVKAL